MAIQAMNETNPGALQRGYGFGAVHTSTVGFAANTSVAYQYITAPADCVLKEVLIKATVTSTASATYTIVVNNMSVAADPAMIGTTLFDADPVLTADVAANATLAADANLAVAKGDIIRVGHTGGTGSGLVGVTLVWGLA
jgi:hypothetical protein